MLFLMYQCPSWSDVTSSDGSYVLLHCVKLLSALVLVYPALSQVYLGMFTLSQMILSV